MKILITGTAGFIGFHMARRLLSEGMDVTGLDNMNDYYDVSLKEARNSILENEYEGYKLHRIDLADTDSMQKLFEEEKFDYVVHLAAQAGVRYSIENPRAYIDSNIVGFLNVLEGCRHHSVKHLVYASSSSVYGMNTRIPFSVHDNVDHPVSLYAASKKSNELMAHVYSHLYDIPSTGLRFFTVYGPWGRPDMAYYMFTNSILKDEKIQVFNYGDMERDFTYIDDIVEGIYRILWKIPASTENWDDIHPDPGSSSAPYRVYNIGNNQPVGLMDFIHVIEELLGKDANMELLPMQPGDVLTTYADIDDLSTAVGYSPDTPIEDGLEKFISWYKAYHKS
ncbi:MAG: NAD-dependent epimerase [Spirochaetota bacterium]